MPQCPQCGSEYDGGTHLCPGEEAPKAHAGDDRFLVSRVYEAGSVLGSYRLERQLGEGAIGRVYLAEHRTLGRKVALKVLRSEFSQTPNVVKRFFGEARAVNQIAHENIVEITDFVSTEDGTYYYIMELLEGETLERRFARTGPIPLTTLIPIAMEICSALQAVHDVGIVHRDLKPENVFLAKRGNREDFVKVLDFGVAKLTKGDKNKHQTVAGTLVGTPDYMSPEQAIGGTVDHRADIYSLGALLYEMSTGRKVFRAASLRELLDLHLDGRVIPPRELASLPQDLPAKFEVLVLSCLEKEPKNRPQSMTEIREALASVYNDTSDLVRVVLTEGTKPRPLAIASVLVVLLLPVIAGIAAFASRSEAPVAISTADSVTIAIDTEPAGAVVVHEEEGRTLGRTPLTARMDRSDEAQSLTVRLEGYEAVTERIVPDRPRRTRIQLKPIRSPDRPP